MILVLSTAGDLHAQEVMKELGRLGQPAQLVDFGQFPESMSMSGRHGSGGTGYSLTVEGRTIDLADVVSVWWRRPQPYGIPASITDPALKSFAISETATAFSGMWQTTDCLWVNDIRRDTAAAHKPWQLMLAEQAGLHVPSTLVTNEPEAARAFWAEHPGGVVYKPFLQTPHAWRETRVVRAEEEAVADAIRLAPVMFQERVPGAADLRVTVIGDELFAAAASLADAAYDLDVRFNPEITYEPHELPDDVAGGLLRLMEALGLEYGAADFRLTPDGEYVFFEVNPAGQFLYVEYSTGQPITAALAAHLRNGKPARLGL